jgi:DNA polymerase-3 subunit gamma/tau
LAARLPMNALTRAWALIMKGLSETREAPDAEAAGEMAIIRLAYAADLPTPDEALRMLKQGAPAAAPRPNSAAGLAPAPVAAPAPQGAIGGGAPRAMRGPALAEADPSPDLPGPLAGPSAALDRRAAPLPGGGLRLSSFPDLVKLAGQKRDARLKVELESYVHVIGFAEGRIDMRLDERAPADFAGRLTQRLKTWTGRHWVVTLASEGGAQTLRDARAAEVMAHPLVRKMLEVFPDAELRAIRDPKAEIAAPETGFADAPDAED